MEHVRLALRGEGGYRQYRIPALAVTKSGRLIAIYDGRADFDDLPAPIDLVMRISDDSGKSWSDQKIFRKHEGTSGYGDASIIVDPTYGELGRIIVLYQYTRDAGFFESVVGSSLEDPKIAHIARSISDDDGATWTHDFITDQLKDPQTEGIFATSGSGARVKHGKFAGRLLQTFVLRRGPQLLSSIGFSDDHGQTWSLGAEIPGGNETAIESLGDGTILIHSRATPFRMRAISRDGGLTIEGHAPDKELPDPSDNGSLCLMSDGSLICSHNHDQDLRRKTLVKRSLDGGKSWPEAVLLELGSSAYSTVCELADGNVGVLFERNSYSEIVFTRVSLNDFKSIDQLPIDLVSEHGIEFTLIPRCIIPARNQGALSLISKERPLVPEVDMSQFNLTERKEVGPVGGSTSGDPLFTSAEYDLMLGPISPGLHLGDEIRISGRLANKSAAKLHNLTISHLNSGTCIQRNVLTPAEKVIFLDIRQKVSEADIRTGVATISISYQAKLGDIKVGEEVSISLSVKTGLPLTEPEAL